MKIIHCSVWGDIECSDLAMSIIDTEHFQRLHYIKQTGFAYKVFPTATSSRFEHSVGVYHVTRMFLSEIGRRQPDVMPSPRIQELIAIAGLIHDIGHGPYSHLFDEYLSTMLDEMYEKWKTHESRSKIIFQDLVDVYHVDISLSEVQFILDRIDDPPSEQWYDMLICNPVSSFDMDKMDYVIRDSLHFGMKFHPDVSRLFRNARVIENRLCFCDRIHDEIQLFFQIRERMHRTIYRHPKISYFEGHLLHALQQLADPSMIVAPFFENNVLAFLQWTDAYLLSQIPRDKWIQVEIRKAPPLSEYHPRYFSCKQWTKAIHNTLYYNRKNLQHFFKISE